MNSTEVLKKHHLKPFKPSGDLSVMLGRKVIIMSNYFGNNQTSTFKIISFAVNPRLRVLKKSIILPGNKIK